MAKLEVGALDARVLKECLPSKLAARFGGSEVDYKVAPYNDSVLAVFFPNWVERGSAIGHSPLWLDGVSLKFTDWVEPGELPRGHLRQKVWIRLRDWSIHCWSSAEVAAAVSGFGELWDVDDRSSGLADVSCYRVLVRCRDVGMIPESILLTVEDRRFRIPIEVGECEAAAPILLGEDTDMRRAGLLGGTREVLEGPWPTPPGGGHRLFQAELFWWGRLGCEARCCGRIFCVPGRRR